MTPEAKRPREEYDRIKDRFAEERDLRLGYRPHGAAQYTSDLSADLSHYAQDPYSRVPAEREPLNDTVECLFIGGGFSALLASAELRKKGVESIRIVERGADVGGTWYWNRYPGVACDVPSYDYLPLLDELGYVPKDHYSKGPEIFEHCRNIAEHYDLYELAVFETTVTSTVWHEKERMWHLETDRGDHMRARFVICANGVLSKPKLPNIPGLETFKGKSFHTSRWDYDYTGDDLSKLRDKDVGIIGTGASAVQAIPRLGAVARKLYVFQRTPSMIEIKNDWPTDPEWAAKLQPGWQAARRQRLLDKEAAAAAKRRESVEDPEERIRRREQKNIEHVMRIHEHIDEIVEDPKTAEALKPWYMFMCKRPCYDNDYLPAFNLPNVELIDTKGQGVNEIRPEGPVFDDQTYPVDVLVMATGFEVQKTGIYNQIIGEGGQDLDVKYASGIRTTLGIHSHGFPNLFIMGGYQATFLFSITDVLKTQGDHIARCIEYARSNGYATMDTTPDAEEWWVQEVIKHRGGTPRNSSECTPGYYNFEGKETRPQDAAYDGGFGQYIEHVQEVGDRMEEYFRFEAFESESAE